MNRQNILLLPGLICDEMVWKYQADHLGDIGDITVPPLNTGSTIEEMAKNVLNGAPDRFALAGFSMGGYVALEMLRQDPSRIERLALLDTSPAPDSPEKANWRKEKVKQCNEGSYQDVIEGMIPLLLHHDHQTGKLAEFMRFMATRVGSDTYVRRQLAIGNRHDTHAELTAARIPIRLIAGRQDAMSSAQSHINLASRLPTARCTIIEDCGHTPTIERPQAVTALLRDWLIYDKV